VRSDPSAAIARGEPRGPRFSICDVHRIAREQLASQRRRDVGNRPVSPGGLNSQAVMASAGALRGGTRLRAFDNRTVSSDLFATVLVRRLYQPAIAGELMRALSKTYINLGNLDLSSLTLAASSGAAMQHGTSGCQKPLRGRETTAVSSDASRSPRFQPKFGGRQFGWNRSSVPRRVQSQICCDRVKLWVQAIFDNFASTR
jgi:hypothetical protein